MFLVEQARCIERTSWTLFLNFSNIIFSLFFRMCFRLLRIANLGFFTDRRDLCEYLLFTSLFQSRSNDSLGSWLQLLLLSLLLLLLLSLLLLLLKKVSGVNSSDSINEWSKQDGAIVRFSSNSHLYGSCSISEDSCAFPQVYPQV